MFYSQSLATELENITKYLKNNSDAIEAYIAEKNEEYERYTTTINYSISYDEGNDNPVIVVVFGTRKKYIFSHYIHHIHIKLTDLIEYIEFYNALKTV